MLLAAAAVGALVIGMVGWQLFGRPATQPTPSPSPVTTTQAPSPTATSTAEPTVVRGSPAPRPTNTTPITGGGIGQAIEFRTGSSVGKVTINRADWVDNGVIAPAAATSYLVVDLTFQAVSGTVTTGPFFTAVSDAQGATHMLTIGAALSPELAMKTLKAGEQNTGQVAFELPRGAVKFLVLDDQLKPVATIDLPG